MNKKRRGNKSLGRKRTGGGSVPARSQTDPRGQAGCGSRPPAGLPRLRGLTMLMLAFIPFFFSPSPLP